MSFVNVQSGGAIADCRWPIADFNKSKIGNRQSEISCCPAGDAVPWLRLVIGLFIAAQTMLFALAISLTPPADAQVRLLLHSAMAGATVVVMALLGWPLLLESLRALCRRRMTMELLFLAGIAGAFGASLQSMISGVGPVYFDVVSILLIVYSIGHAINQHSRSRALSMAAMTRGVETARRIADGRLPIADFKSEIGTWQLEIVPVEQIKTGELVEVMPGELIPIDGRIVRGTAMVRQTPFTGRSGSSVLGPGDEVLAQMGCEDASLTIEATSSGDDRRVDRLATMIEEAQRSPAHLQRQVDRLVQWFLPIVLAAAGAAFAYWTKQADWHRGLFVALSVLLVACPCAAGLATPLAVWTAMGRLGRRGLVLRSGEAVERLAGIDTVIFDKTGTLSEESLVLREVVTGDGPHKRARAMAILAAVERCSAHPVAKALSRLAASDEPELEVMELRTLPGRGVEATVCMTEGAQPGAAHAVRIVRDEQHEKTSALKLSLVVDEQWAATVILEERLRETATETIATLQAAGLPVLIMTGDSARAAAGVADSAHVRSDMTPEQKHAAVQMKSSQRPLFVGDGLNDAAAMAAAHVGIAIADGAETTRHTAAGVLHGGDLRLIPDAIATSRRAVAVIRSNLHWAAAYNSAGIFIAGMGWLNPIYAALLMAGSSALVAWRSFGIADCRLPIANLGESTAPPPIRKSEIGNRKWLSLALTGQAVVLALLAGLSLMTGSALVSIFAMVALALWQWHDRLPLSADHVVAMVALGGLGMNLGWWMDAGFGPAAQGGQLVCCASGAPFASAWGMYGGMLLLGVPAMYLLRRRREVLSLRKWCCVGPLLLGVPGMVLGMWAGALLSATLHAQHPAAVQVILAYGWMMSGMVVGMLLPHLFGAGSGPDNLAAPADEV